MPIIGAEDEDFENDVMIEEQCPAFNNIEKLKGRPTHLLVFLQHVILQFDCAPLLCYLHAELFKTHNSKETKKYFVEFYANFLDKGAVLRVTTVPANTLTELERTRADLSEEQQKQYALEIQEYQAAEVATQLEDFRQKRKMGMTPNEAELVDVENHYPTDRIPMEMKEKSVAENLLEKMNETQSNIVSDEDKCQHIFQAVAFYMKHLGVKTRPVDSKKSRGFFRRPQKDKTKKEEPKAKSYAFGWIPRNVEVKPKTEVEVEKREVIPERKVSSKGSLIDPVMPSFRKPGTSGGSASLAGSDLSDVSGLNMAAANSPDSITSDDPLPLTEGGEVFPTVPTIGEPISPESPMEENLEKDSPDGPLFVMEGPGVSPTSPPPQLEEMDPRLLELERDPPNWRESASSDTLGSLSKKETKRQEVINELFATEHAHVRMLTVLQTVFSKPMEREEIFTVTELATIFPNLDEIIDMHYAFYENLKKLRVEDNFIVKSIGTTLLNRFGGTEGEWFQKLTARFCSHQSWALDQIKINRKKDARCNSFILDAESKPQCRRLQLKDIIPTEMQRLTKYPLLLENIAKSTEDQGEKESVQQSAEFCRKILNHVNEEVKVMENLLTLKDYQRRLDTSGLRPSNDLYTEYRNIDLTQKKMIYEGPLTWRVTKEKAIEVQCVLLGDLLVLLQRQDDKMVLKCQSKSNIVQEGGRQMLSPIIKLDSVFLREVATDRKAFYVIFTWDSGAQIYELVAQSIQEMKGWTDVIKKAVDELKKSGLHQKLPLPPGGGPPLSPSVLSAPMSPTENGGLKSTSDRDKDGLTDDHSTNTRHLLIDYLSEKGFDLIGHTNSDQEKVANCALDEVMSLKRLLVTSISLSDDIQLDENGREGPERTDQDTDGSQSTEERQSSDSGARVDDVADGTEDGGISAPLVLSKERMEEVRKRLQSLEEQLARLQTVEEAHHRLQEALSKFSLEGGNLQ